MANKKKLKVRGNAITRNRKIEACNNDIDEGFKAFFARRGLQVPSIDRGCIMGVLDSDERGHRDAIKQIIAGNTRNVC